MLEPNQQLLDKRWGTPSSPVYSCFQTCTGTLNIFRHYLGELHVRTQKSASDCPEITWTLSCKAHWHTVRVISECDLCYVMICILHAPHRRPPPLAVVKWSLSPCVNASDTDNLLLCLKAQLRTVSGPDSEFNYENSLS